VRRASAVLADGHLWSAAVPAAARKPSSPHPKKSHAVRSGKAAAGEDTRAPPIVQPNPMPGYWLPSLRDSQMSFARLPDRRNGFFNRLLRISDIFDGFSSKFGR